MVDTLILGQMANIEATINCLAPDLSWIQEHVGQAARFAHQIETITDQFSSPFEKLLLEDRTWAYIQKIENDHARIIEWAERGRKNSMLVSLVLPKRGWYLSGNEPCTLTDKLAAAIRKEEWDAVDQDMMQHLPQFKNESLDGWLALGTCVWNRKAKARCRSGWRCARAVGWC
jgi:hypothetical protein